MNLDNRLAQLEDEQLVRRLKEEATYSFKHSLTQETVYRTLLKTQRRALHRSVAQAIEKAFPDRKGKMSDVLAYHWEQAEVPDRARRYLFRAAQNAMRAYANQEALDLLGRALAQREGAKPDELMALHESRARMYEFQSQYAQALDDYQAALPLARTAKREIDECRILSRIAWIYSLSGNSAQAFPLARQVEEFARNVQDQAAMLRAYLVQGLVAQTEGNIADSYPRLRSALFASRASDEPVMEAESWYFLGVQNDLMGRFGRAAACARKTSDIKRGLSDHTGVILALFLQSKAEAGRGNYDAALEILEQGYSIAKQVRNPFGLAQYQNTRAWFAADLGDWETAYEMDRIGLSIARQAPMRQPEMNTLLSLTLDCLALNRIEEAEQYLLEARQWLGRAEFGYYTWRWQLRFDDAHARWFIAHQQIDSAAPLVDDLLTCAAQTQSAKYQMRGLMLRAEIHLARDQQQLAHDDALAACKLADLINYVPGQLHARQLLARVCDPIARASAEHYRQASAQLVQRLEQSLHHPDLRRSFARGIGKAFAINNVA